jgi:crossover junction endodeoxyribonuclease RusA
MTFTGQPQDYTTTTQAPDTQTGPWVLEFPYPKNPIPMNGSRGNHRAHARKVRGVRIVAARWAAIAGIPALGRCQVELTWHVLDRTRRDAENLSYTLKAMCDGLVDAGLVTDDTTNLMKKLMPEIVLENKLTHLEAWMTLTISRWPAEVTA